MNVTWIGTLSLGLVVTLGVAGASQQARALRTEKEVRSYALGMDLGNQLRKRSIEVDPSVFARGMADALAGGKTLLTDAEAKAAIARIQADAKAKQILPNGGAGDLKASQDNKKSGDAFMAANRKKPGVVTLPSGLQYKVLVQGAGRKPTIGDTVICQYRGTLVDGTEFDNSYSRGEPATFPVTGVIPGWTEALQLMPVGSKWQIVVPSNLAYGPRGSGDRIGPNATLIFEIELVSIR